MAMCTEGHAHYSVSTRWGDGAAIFVRCHPTIHRQLVSQDIADELFRYQHPGGSMRYLEQHASGTYGLPFGLPFAPAQMPPEAVAALILDSAPQSAPPSPPPYAPRPRAANESRGNTPTGFPAAPPSGPPSASGVDAATLQDANELAELLRVRLPGVHIERVITAGARQCLVLVTLLETVNAEAKPTADAWMLTMRGVGVNGPLTREWALPRAATLDLVAVRLVEILAIAGSVFVRGSATGFDVADSVPDSPGYEQQYTRLVIELILASLGRDSPAAPEAEVAQEAAQEAILKLFERRPDIQAGMSAVFPGR